MEKQPFTDERVGSLLADVIRWKLDSQDVTFKQDGEYVCKISFRVEDEQLRIHNNEIFRIKKTMPTQEFSLTKEEAAIITDRLLKCFLDSDLIEHHGINLARSVINGFVEE